jgi:hypothetical protein
VVVVVVIVVVVGMVGAWQPLLLIINIMEIFILITKLIGHIFSQK